MRSAEVAGDQRRTPSRDDVPLVHGRREQAPVEAHDALEVVVRFHEREIQAAARRFGPSSPLPVIFARRTFHELVLRRFRHIRFRTSQNAAALAAYAAMRGDELEEINALQTWASWRTIPRNLNRRLPNRPMRVIDLCCGVGESTTVLAYYCPPGSTILGLEFNPRFVEIARKRTYHHRQEQPAKVSFHVQSVLDIFCDGQGAPLPEAGVDLINSSGAVGCHFDRRETGVLARECARVIRGGGLAMLDSGRDGMSRRTLTEIFGRQGFVAVHEARSCLLDRRPQVCFQKRASEEATN